MKKKSRWFYSRSEKDGGEEKESAAMEEASKSLSGGKSPEEDIALFHSMFPEVKGEDIPEEIWEAVENGESLSAAWALYTLCQEREQEKIRKKNRENEEKAPPRIHTKGEEDDYFSPDAVRSMSRREIQQNYRAILKSMEKWK